jgi:hypothetical protein
VDAHPRATPPEFGDRHAAKRLIRRGDIAHGRRLSREGARLAGDTRVALPALDALIDAGLFDGRVEESSATAHTMMQLARRHGDLHFQSIAASGLALAPAYGGHPDPEAPLVLAELDDLPLSPSARGWVAYTRGEPCQQHDPQQARGHFDDALQAARGVSNRFLEGAAIVSSCSLRARTGDPVEALGVFAAAIDHCNRVANTPDQITALRDLAILFERVEVPEALAELLGAVDHTDYPTYGEEAQRLDSARAWTRATLGAKGLEELAALGSGRTITTAARAALRAIDALLHRTSA